MRIQKYINYLLFTAFFLSSSFTYSFELGIGTHFQSYPKDSDYYLKLIKEYGFTSYRDDYPWSKIEQEKGVYNVSKHLLKSDNAFLNSKDKYNLSGVIILDYGNKLYNNGGYPNDGKSITAFANYASWTAKRFKGKVKYYEIWNEWTLGTGMLKFRNEIPGPEIYLELVKKTSEAIRKVDPDAIILAGSFNPLEQRARFIDYTDVEWFDKLIKLGLMKYIDGVSLHTYSFLNRNRRLRTAEGNLEEIDNFYNRFSKVTPNGLSIYITEVGVTNYDGPGGLSDDDAANFIKDYTIGAKKRSYIKGLWWYDLINDGDDLSKKEHNFGFFKHDDTPKKSAEKILNISSK